MKLLSINDFITRLHDAIQDLDVDADILPIGTSRSGHVIEAIKIVHMPRHALFLGFPHPNEPLAELIMEAIVEEAALRQSPNNHACWYLVPVWDVDGALRNQAWWSETLSIGSMIAHWYRPAPSEQVEWTFPLNYGGVHFDQPLPETEAVRRLIDMVNPELLVSLHNGIFPGAYTLISSHGSQLAPKIRDVFHTYGLDLKTRSPIPYVETFAEGVFGLPHARLEIDYLRNLKLEGSISFYDNGGASFDYVNASCLSLVMELPLFKWIGGSLVNSPVRRRDLAERQITWWESLEQDLADAFADPELLYSEHPLLSSPRYFYQRRESDLATIKQELAYALKNDDLAQESDLTNYMSALFTVSTQYSQLFRGCGRYTNTAKSVLHELETLSKDHLSELDPRVITNVGRTIIRHVLDRVR
ncbi:hypothetical protein [Sulfobacillus thermosulfidooxidans]|uniref:hypothetical protein n=1 Tax=Sulfobacillus thermosulfidooxidans TaxID=28034 RepID=UPI0006B4DA50|nr:hypothetical protein [Sulfobacillus thermosulfidooxidans]